MHCEAFQTRRATLKFTFENIAVCARALEPVEEGVSELCERPKLLLWINHQRVAGHDAVAFGVHDRDESEILRKLIQSSYIQILNKFHKFKFLADYKQFGNTL
jgi:hypothetical protein